MAFFSPTTHVAPPPHTASSFPSSPSRVPASSWILLFRFTGAWWTEIWQKNGESSWIKMMMKWDKCHCTLLTHRLAFCSVSSARLYPSHLHKRARVSINRIAAAIRAFHPVYRAQNTDPPSERWVGVLKQVSQNLRLMSKCSTFSL
jgi:hypothetical protein